MEKFNTWQDLYGVMWDASRAGCNPVSATAAGVQACWQPGALLDDVAYTTSVNGQLRATVAWAGTSGVAIVGYADRTGTTSGPSKGLDWARWSASAGWQSGSALAGTTGINSSNDVDPNNNFADEQKLSVRIASFNSQSKALAIVTTSSQRLYVFLYDAPATTWTYPTLGGVAQPITQTDLLPVGPYGMPYALFLNRFVAPTITTFPTELAKTIQRVAAAPSALYSLGGAVSPVPLQLGINDPGGIILGGLSGDPYKHEIVIAIPPTLSVSWSSSMTICATGSTAKMTAGGAPDGSGSCPGGWLKLKRTFPDSPTNKLLKLDVTQDFAPGDWLTLSGLTVVQAATPLASTQQQLVLNLSSAGYTGIPDQQDPKFIQLTEALELTDHTSGQLKPTTVYADNALRQNPLTGVSLFRFRLKPYGVDVGQKITADLQFTVTPSAGLAMSNFSNWALAGASGAITVSGGASWVKFSGGDVTAATDYVLTADIAAPAGGFAGGEQVMVSFGSGGITRALGSKSGVDVMDTAQVTNGIRNTVTPGTLILTHVRPGFQTITAAPAAGSTRVLANKDSTVTWSAVGSADPNVTFEFYRTGIGNPITQSIATVTSPLTWAVPSGTSASTTAQVCIRETAAAYAHIRNCSSAFTIVETAAFANQAVNNAFVPPLTLQPWAFTNKDLLQFTVTASGGTVRLKRFNVTAGFNGSPMTWANVSQLQLFESGNPTPLTKASPTDANFDLTGFPLGSRDIAAGATKTYILRGNFTSLIAGHQFHVDLASGGVTADALVAGSGTVDIQTIVGTMNFGVPAVAKDHKVSAYSVTPPTAVKYQSPLTIAWTESNINHPTRFWYSVDALPSNDPAKVWTEFTGNGLCLAGVTTGTCTTDPAMPNNPPSASAAANAMIMLQGIEQTDSQTVKSVSQPFKVIETATLANQAVANAFLQPGTISPAKDLLQFKVTVAAGTVKMRRLTFGTSFPTPATGTVMTWSNVSTLELWENETNTLLATKTSPTDADFDLTAAPRSIAVGSPKTYTLRGTFVSLTAGNQFHVDLAASGVVADGDTSKFTNLQSVSGAITVSGSPISRDHVVSMYQITSPAAGDTAVVGTRKWGQDPTKTVIPVTWTGFGDADPSNVTVSYRVNGGSPVALTCLSVAPGSCDAMVPDAVSTNVQIIVNDNTKPTVQGTSGTFTIGGIVDVTGAGLLDLNTSSISPTDPGDSWIIGTPYTITWRQVGTFRALVELSMDGGNIWRQLIAQDVIAPSEVSVTFAYTPVATDITSTARVRVRPEVALSTLGNREYPMAPAVFAIQPAFSKIDPGNVTSAILKNTAITIAWTRLPGTESGAAGFPIDNVILRFLDSTGSGVAGLPPITVPNTGSYAWTAPNQGYTTIHLKICDARAPYASVCAESGPFDLVDMSITVVPKPGPAYRLGEKADIAWGGGLKGDVVLTLRDASGTKLLDVTTVPVPASTLGFSWSIPTTLTAPLSNVHIRLADASNPGVFVDSTPLTIHGVLTNVSIVPAPPIKIENVASDASNDVTISWTSVGVNQVKLWLKRQSDASYLPLSSFGAAGADAVTGSAFAWTNILSPAKTPQATIKVTQPGDETLVYAETAPFPIIGEFRVTKPDPITFNLNDPAQIPILVQWQTLRGPVTPIRLRILDVNSIPQVLDAATGVTQLTLPNPSSPTSFSWTPQNPKASLKVEVCDASDTSVCAVSASPFTVAGMSATTDRSGYTLTPSGVPVTIQWVPVNGSGRASLFYRIGSTGMLQPLTGASAAGLISLENVANTFIWTVLRNFPDLSNQLQVVAKDDSGTPMGASVPPLTIRGALSFIAPASGTYVVGDNITISWSTVGEIPQVDLGWSTDGCASQTSILLPAGTQKPNDQPQPSTFSWGPLAVASSNMQFCLKDSTPGHDPVTAVSALIVVGTRLAFTSPITGLERWASSEDHDVTWSTQGNASQVSLDLVYSTDNFVTSRVKPIIPSIGNAGSYRWTVTDLNALVYTDTGAALNPQQTPEVKAKLRISDVTPGHPPVPQESNVFTINYYKVTWKVVDAATGSPISNLQVTDSTGWSNAPAFDLSGLGVTHYYPYGLQFYTAWSLNNNNGFSDYSQGPRDTAPVQKWDSVQDQTRVVQIEVVSSETVTWSAKAEYQYDATTVPPQVDISAWLEKSGKIVDTLLIGAFVEIYENGALVRSIPVPVIPAATGTPPDATGNFRFIWDLKRDNGTLIDDGKTYFARVVIRRQPQRDFSTAMALNIAVPKKILTAGAGSGGGGSTGSGLTLTDLQTELQPIKNATVGPTSTLAAQVTGAQVQIQSDIATAKNDLSTQIGAVKADTGAIKAETDKISTQVIPKIDNVKTYLADPNAGLPKILDNQKTTNDQLKAQRRGGILGGDMELEVGGTGTIQYRPVDPALVPSLTIYDALGSPILSPPMGLNGGLYQASVSLAVKGQYRVVVSEPTSTNSNGTLDSVSLLVREPLATAQAVTDVTTKLTGMEGTLSTLDSKVTNLATTLNQVKATTDSTKTIADQLALDTQTLIGKWGTQDAAALMNELNTLVTRLGTPPAGSSVSQEIQTVKDAVAGISGTGLQEIKDAMGVPAGTSLYADMAKDATVAKQATLTGLIGTPRNGSIADDIAAITGGPGGGGGSSGGSLTDIQNAITDLKSDVGEAQLRTGGTTLAQLATDTKNTLGTAPIGSSVAGELAQVKTDMAKDATAAKELTLGQVQTDMAKDATVAKDAKLDLVRSEMAKDATVAKKADLDQVQADVTTIKNALAGLPPTLGTDLANVKTALDTLIATVGNPSQKTDVDSAFATVNTAIAALSTKVDLTAKTTDLDPIKTDVAQILTALNGLPPTLGTDLANLKTSLTTLISTIGSPSQKSDVDAAFLAVNNALGALSTKVDLTAKTTDLDPIKTDVAQILTALNGLPPTLGTDLANLKTSLNTLLTTVGTPAQDAATQAAFTAINTTLTQIGTDMAKDVTVAKDTTVAKDAAVTTLKDSLTQLTLDLGTVSDGSGRSITKVIQDVESAIKGLPGTKDYTDKLATLQTALDALKTDVASVPKTDMSGVVAGLQESVGKGKDSLLSRLEELQKTVASAQGSGAAVGLSEGAYRAANEALTILQQLRNEVAKGTGGTAGPVMLTQVGEKLSEVSKTVTVLPGQIGDEELGKQLKKLVEQAKGVATEKGYHFDSLYEMNEAQATDVKTMRNQVEELKALLEMQRSILQRNMDQPIVKTWFESQ